MYVCHQTQEQTKVRRERFVSTHMKIHITEAWAMLSLWLYTCIITVKIELNEYALICLGSYCTNEFHTHFRNLTSYHGKFAAEIDHYLAITFPACWLCFHEIINIHLFC